MTSTARIALGLSALVILTVRTTLVESSEAARARGPGGGIGTIRAATGTSRIAGQAKVEAAAGVWTIGRHDEAVVPIEGLLLVSGVSGPLEQVEYPALFLRDTSENMTFATAAFSDGDVSPIGEEIAYVVFPEQWPPTEAHIWRSRTDGSDAVNLTERAGLGGVNCSPAWSPDGAMIAFQHSEPRPGEQPCAAGQTIWVINRDGTSARQVTADVGDPPKARFPRWSPDASRVVYGTYGGNASVRLDGTDRRHHQELKGGADWSPDGQMIAGSTLHADTVDGEAGTWTQLVVESVDGSRREVLVRQFIRAKDVEAHADTAVRRGHQTGRISDLPWLCGPVYPRWSPSGDRIAFLAALPFDPEGPWYREQLGVWTYDVATGGLTQVVEEGAMPSWLSWGAAPEARPARLGPPRRVRPVPVQSGEDTVGGWWERTFDSPYPGDGTQVQQVWGVGYHAVAFKLSARNAAGRDSFGYYQWSDDGEIEFHEVFAWSDPAGTVKIVTMEEPFGLYVFNEEGIEPPCRWLTEDALNRDGARMAWVFHSPAGDWVIAFEDVSLPFARDHNDVIVRMLLVPGATAARVEPVRAPEIERPARGVWVAPGQRSRSIPITGRLLVTSDRTVADTSETYSFLVRNYSDDITPAPAFLVDADLSPVSWAVAYDQAPSDEWPPSARHVWTCWINGSRRTNLTGRAGLSGVNCVPCWSPDGKKIAFQHSEPEPGQQPCDAGFQIWVMNADGTGAHQVTPEGVQLPMLRFVRWSPDGTRLSCGAHNKDAVMNVDGSGVRILYGTRGGPDWSPDGRRLVSSGFAYGTVDGEEGVWRSLVVTDPDGNDPRTLVQQFVRLADIETHAKRLESEGEGPVDRSDIRWAVGPHVPRWSPDGNQIAFLAAMPFDPDGVPYRQQLEVWLYDLPTGALTRLTDDDNDDNWLSWR